jgi:hypothetical protein
MAKDGAAEVVPRSKFLDHAHVLARKLRDDVEDRAVSVALPRERFLRCIELVLEAALGLPESESDFVRTSKGALLFSFKSEHRRMPQTRNCFSELK